ncbi:MAG: hypothetical protein LUG98_04050 [Tannerellaceae bacterium]|nr:hypothetical protein [Tannerellaceae bacterium]
MNKTYTRTMGVLIGWSLLQLAQFYWIDWFFVGFVRLGILFILLVLLIQTIIKLLKERKTQPVWRSTQLLLFGCLLYYSISPGLVNRYIEKADWMLLYNQRIKVVKQVEAGQLYPDSNGFCQLPSRLFPLSESDEISISKDPENGNLSVIFYIYRGFFEGSTTSYVYTTNQKSIDRIEERSRINPHLNRKLRENWYRTSTKDFPPV